MGGLVLRQWTAHPHLKRTQENAAHRGTPMCAPKSRRHISPASMDARNEQEPPERRQPDSRRVALVGMLVALLLVVLGLILVKVLGDTGRLQDCVMSGRTNCAPIETPPADR